MLEHLETISKAMKGVERANDVRRTTLRPVLLDLVRQARSASPSAVRDEDLVERNLEKAVAASLPIPELLQVLADALKSGA